MGKSKKKVHFSESHKKNPHFRQQRKNFDESEKWNDRVIDVRNLDQLEDDEDIED